MSENKIFVTFVLLSGLFYIILLIVKSKSSEKILQKLKTDDSKILKSLGGSICKSGYFLDFKWHPDFFDIIMNSKGIYIIPQMNLNMFQAFVFTNTNEKSNNFLYFNRIKIDNNNNLIISYNPNFYNLSLIGYKEITLKIILNETDKEIIKKYCS
ncbi:hypothetical protein [Chryseobacterium oryzae]|uniref:Uncharacterized protein n=1 Tax=Chryseobacterium oryzae TaxID=2929799 RepID=A0ABY4BD31_9FLAO|nr:hypothetical protein [Chryseobacterium oryzae]UOE37032.1 hypothetical protein MTP08_08100 [Chryseobacterium oryzae]